MCHVTDFNLFYFILFILFHSQTPTESSGSNYFGSTFRPKDAIIKQAHQITQIIPHLHFSPTNFAVDLTTTQLEGAFNVKGQHTVLFVLSRSFS